ncbi:MAG: PAS domain S-box protein [Verrucomicrobia bacterium]|nr:PAS domain S-box protein [Verrucomicrobiota bacterium]
MNVLIVAPPTPTTEQMVRELAAAGLRCAPRFAATRTELERALAGTPPDLVLAEHPRPDLSGPEVIESLKSRHLDIPVILIGTDSTEEASCEHLRWGAEDFVSRRALARLPAAVLGALKRKEAERKRQAAEDALRRSEEQYRLIAEHARDPICLLNLHGRFLYASPAFQSVLGYPPAELIGRSCLEIAHPEDQPVLYALVEEARFLHESRTADIRYRHQDGRTLVFESAVAFVFDEHGNPQRAVMVSRDISERKRAETEIERLAAFPRNNPNPVLAFAGDGGLIYFNDAAQAMAAALRKEHPKDILPLNVAAVVKMSLATGQSDLRLENSIAGRTLAWSFYPIQSSDVVHCYAEDATERLELESRLRQSQKMESVGQLAAGVAHDFNNILTIIQGHSSLLLASRELSPAALEAMRQVSVAAERAANLTRQLLMFSRKQLAQRHLIDLNEVIKEASKMLRVLVGDAIQVHLDCAVSLPAVYADPGMMQQVLINLAANARDAMPKGGHLTIHSSNVELSDDEATHLPEARAGRFVRLKVADSGCGMDAATLERIFEPFFTTKEPGQGTGLGLATVYAIVKQHQGWVEVKSDVGQGTTFTLYFPVASKSLEFDTEQARLHVRGGTETILVVEDEPALRELVIEILQQYGYKTIEAASGVQALAIWAERKAEINLVLTDVMMPEGVSGRDLAEKIHAENPSMKVIYSSGYPLDVLGREFFLREGLSFLQKPYQPQTLAKTVRECLDAPAVGTAKA